jgi:2-methylcitrate dehydratase PrpD
MSRRMTEPVPDYDVVVVGDGPAGSAAASARGRLVGSATRAMASATAESVPHPGERVKVRPEEHGVTFIAADLARWAVDYRPVQGDLDLAGSALLDTVAVAMAARNEPLVAASRVVSEVTRWAAAGHALDFDDVHLESTSHISAVCVPAVLAVGGDARAYLAAAGVMARLGSALGWSHYSAGWHTTVTAGAPAAAVGAGVALGLDAAQIATAMALAVPAAGGVRSAFGSDGKSLQVGFAADAGVRAAQLAAAGATANIGAVDSWFDLMGGDRSAVDLTGPAVPGGLAVKLFPCCYALQRPISAIAGMAGGNLDPGSVKRIVIKTPRSTVLPLIRHWPNTGVEGKFSLEYAVATALLDRYPGMSSFTDEAVLRPAARRLMGLLDVQLDEGGDRVLAGELHAELHVGEEILHARERFPSGSPEQPATHAEMARKVDDCLKGTNLSPHVIQWSTACEILRDYL